MTAFVRAAALALFLLTSPRTAARSQAADRPVSFDKAGSLFVQDWNFAGRFTKLKKVAAK